METKINDRATAMEPGIEWRRLTQAMPDGRVKVRLRAMLAGRMLGEIRQQAGGWIWVGARRGRELPRLSTPGRQRWNLASKAKSAIDNAVKASAQQCST